MNRPGKQQLILLGLVVLNLALLALLWGEAKSYKLSALPDQPVSRSAPQTPDRPDQAPATSSPDKAALAGRSGSVRLLWVGDIMLDRHVKEQIEQNGFKHLLQPLTAKRFFRSYDLVGGNLEGAVTRQGRHYPPVNKYDFAFAPADLAKLKQAGFTYLNLANNHLADQGRQGMVETRQNLADLDYLYAGCADTRVGACTATTTQRNGIKLALAGLSGVYQALPEPEMASTVQSLADRTDLVVVNVHWGKEYAHLASKQQKQTARLLVDNGADVVVGHHPHVVQGLEIYQGRPIFYSLGNFIFDQYFSRATQQGLALDMKLDKHGYRIRLVPLLSRLSQVSLMTAESKQEFFNQLASWSFLSNPVQKQVSEQGMITGRFEPVRDLE